jgi:hypothetical protein
MKKLGEVLKSLSEKAGIKDDDETLKKLLAIQEISLFELPDEVAGALEQKLLTEDSAVANPIVRSKVFAEALNGVDAELDGFVTDISFDDNFKASYKSIQKNTNEKVRKIKEGLKAKLEETRTALEEAKKSGNKSADPNAIAKITALENQIRELTSNAEAKDRMHSTELENLRAQNINDKKQFTLKSVLSGKPLPKNGLAPDVNIQVAKTLVESEMAKHGLVFLFDDAGNMVLKQKKDGAEIDYFVDNKKVDASSFIDGVLAQNKYVHVNDSAQPTNGGNNNFQQPQNVNPQAPVNTSVVEESNRKLAELGINLGTTV